MRRALVVGQLALTTTLLIGAGLLVRSFQRLGGVDLGMQTEGVVAINLHGSAWWDLEEAAAQAQWDAVMAAIRAVPGVQEAGAMDYVPLGGDYSCDGVERDAPNVDAGSVGEEPRVATELLRQRLADDLCSLQHAHPEDQRTVCLALC